MCWAGSVGGRKKLGALFDKTPFKIKITVHVGYALPRFISKKFINFCSFFARFLRLLLVSKDIMHLTSLFEATFTADPAVRGAAETELQNVFFIH